MNVFILKNKTVIAESKINGVTSDVNFENSLSVERSVNGKFSNESKK